MPNGAANTTIDSLSTPLSNRVATMRKSFKAYATLTADWTETKAELAPKFMTLFTAIVNEVGVGFRFTNYVHLLDPSCPLHRDEVDGHPGYRQHKSYIAADYLRRLVNAAPRGAGRAADAQAGRRDPLLKIARLLKSILAVGVKNEDLVWQAVQQELEYSAGQMTTLRSLVATTPPLLAFTGMPKVARITASIVHFPKAAQVTATPPVGVPAPTAERERPRATATA